MSIDFLKDSQFRVFDPERDVSRALQLYHRSMQKTADRSPEGSHTRQAVIDSVLDLQRAQLRVVVAEGVVLSQMGEKLEQ